MSKKIEGVVKILEALSDGLGLIAESVAEELKGPKETKVTGPKETKNKKSKKVEEEIEDDELLEDDDEQEETEDTEDDVDDDFEEVEDEELEDEEETEEENEEMSKADFTKKVSQFVKSFKVKGKVNPKAAQKKITAALKIVKAPRVANVKQKDYEKFLKLLNK